MDHLIKKIEQLRKALYNLKANSSNNPLVPAIKVPEVKSLALPSNKSLKPIKMPGIEPQSKKDPKKVAQQLKNPKPKKPKIEMLKFEKNGQWSLQEEDNENRTKIGAGLP